MSLMYVFVKVYIIFIYLNCDCCILASCHASPQEYPSSVCVCGGVHVGVSCAKAERLDMLNIQFLSQNLPNTYQAFTAHQVLLQLLL